MTNHPEANKLAALNQAMRSCGRCADMTRDERASHYKDVLDEVVLRGNPAPCEYLSNTSSEGTGS